MMDILNTSMTLGEIEEVLAEQLKDSENNIRILGDLKISYEDYCYLLLKIRGLEQYHEKLELMEKYRLSVLVSWVIGLRFEKSEAKGCNRIKNQLLGMEQHHVRSYIASMLNTFDEYGLNTFQMTENASVEDLLELLVVHTGIPSELQDDFYHLLDDSLSYGDFSSIAGRFLMRLPKHMQHLYTFVKREVVIAMIEDCRKMFADYRLYGITRREAYNKYPLMSSDIMQGCFRWCEAQEVYARCFG